MGWWWWRIYWLVVVAVGIIEEIKSNVRGEEVTSDGRSLMIDGQRKILFSGSIHYPRTTPQMWTSLIAKAKEGGLDVIQTYVFWNLHEPQPGEYDFSGRCDIVKFIKEIKAQGLFVCLRIGPFIEAEWTYGGFPFWLHDVPGIIFRADNEPFKYYMQNFTTKIVEMMKSEGLYASQGGPIILSQIENEYQNIEAAFHGKGPSYVRWAAKMAVGLQTGVPWIMCKQTDAPDPIDQATGRICDLRLNDSITLSFDKDILLTGRINTCNGMRCGETFGGPNSPNKPSIWTENWTSFYQVYGGEPYIRSAENIAFHVALFIAKNGSYVNYYMYHGGTNFGRTSSSYVITSYYDQAPLDEYGLLRQPKWGHLKELHAAIKSCSITILEATQSVLSLGQLQEAYVFGKETGECVAFLVNNDTKHNANVEFHNKSYVLLPKSIIILLDCQKVIFDTAKVSTEKNKRIIRTSQTFDSEEKWEEFQDVIPNYIDTSLQSNTLLEHINTTKDKSDYLWYAIRFDNNSSCLEPQLHVESRGHVVHAYVNNKYVGAAHGSRDVKEFIMESPIMLNNGANNVSLLSVMTGLPDSGAFLERRFAGLSRVEINCSQQEFYNFTTNYTWGYQVGLLGEKLQIFNENNLDNVQWSKFGVVNQPLTWYKTTFDAPSGNEPMALNLSTMGKGEAWINGQSIGRYWVSFLTSKGLPSQSLYHVPRSFLRTNGNQLVLVEEYGGNPLQISLATVSVTSNSPPFYSYSHLSHIAS